jgi:sugar-specific transcriptional regulator TrmB
LVVCENPYENAFIVKVNKTEAVSELRKAIKEEIDDNVKAKDLKLWKVDISLKKENTKININIRTKSKLDEVLLEELSISDWFCSTFVT